MKNLTDQQKGSLLAFTAVMFITPDSLFIRLSNIETWGLLFYRGAIPFVTVFLALLMVYKSNFFKLLFFHWTSWDCLCGNFFHYKYNFYNFYSKH